MHCLKMYLALIRLSYISIVVFCCCCCKRWYKKKPLENSCKNGQLVNCMNSLYLVGGLKSNKSATIDRYNEAADTWETVAFLVKAFLKCNNIVVVKNKIYILGGYNVTKKKLTRKVLTFNTDTLLFEKLSIRMLAKLIGSASCALDSSKYLPV